MKKLFSVLLFLSLLVGFSCNDNATAPTTGGGGIGGGGGGNTGGVSYTVALVQEQQTQDLYFEFKPSVDVVINTITGNCPEANINNEQVAFDGTTVYRANSPAYIGPLTILAQGQKWTFTIVGKVGSSTGAAYTATANLTIQ